MHRRVLVVVMDGVGVREERFGNAVDLAWTPAMDWLKTNGLYTTLRAHGTAVGLPSDADIGNSDGKRCPSPSTCTRQPRSTMPQSAS